MNTNRSRFSFAIQVQGGRLGAVLLGALALTSARAAHAAEPGPSPLIGAEPAEPCAWPTTAMGSFGQGLFGVGCGAVLIHPELIAVFAECPQSALSFEGINLGDNTTNLQSVESVAWPVEESCFVVVTGNIAFCRLAEPVDLPLTPVVYGCETGIMEIGREVAMAGFGHDMLPLSEGESGVKRWGLTEIMAVSEDSVLVADTGPITCSNQDLGSPLYVEYPDGSWHVLGVSSESADCEGTTLYRRLDPYLADAEAHFGLDLTPCHDADGTWAPSEACSELSMAGPVGGGSWEDWCAETPTVALSETCGPGLGVAPAEPTVVIDTPADQATIPSGELITIEVSVDHPVVGVQLEIQGMLQPAVDATWPHAFADVLFPDGVYTVVAVAEGDDGITRESAPIEVHVGGSDSGDGDGDETGDGGGDPDAGDGTGETGDTLGAEDGPATESCACRTQASAPTGLAWASLMLLTLVRIRRSD